MLLAAWVPAACRPPAPVPPPAGLAWLEVEIRDLAAGDGRIGLALFDSAEAFAAGDAPVRRAFLPVADGGCLWRLEDLPAGEYAVKAFHDLDGDGVLDTGPFGAPSEPYGFSNGARGRLGPPSWARARFRLPPGGRRVSMTLE